MSAGQATDNELQPKGPRVPPHPLDPLSITEIESARQALLKVRGANVAVRFRAIYLEEPPKKELAQFLDLEHSGKLAADTPRPARLAKVQYDVVRGDKKHEFTESWVDINSEKETRHRVVDAMHISPIILQVVSSSRL